MRGLFFLLLILFAGVTATVMPASGFDAISSARCCESGCPLPDGCEQASMACKRACSAAVLPANPQPDAPAPLAFTERHAGVRLNSLTRNPPVPPPRGFAISDFNKSISGELT
ncbi:MULTISPECIES: hypothetical protein [unclassified Sphingopyxis]|jgi:hypothetical protein|uniref:hypothetical protein n=1 Tax=unclassified Sphingopyxis TaxID=2614943 RepID=UPI000AC6F89B|nr:MULTISPECIES: hypothetical protein [unclassified Sphingopyxis]